MNDNTKNEVENNSQNNVNSNNNNNNNFEFDKNNEVSNTNDVQGDNVSPNTNNNIYTYTKQCVNLQFVFSFDVKHFVRKCMFNYYYRYPSNSLFVPFIIIGNCEVVRV
jgi:hypothetical protein